MMTFTAFRPDTFLGTHDFVLSREIVDRWTDLFPDDRASLPTIPASMMAMILMRAFTNILSERPQGNIHAGQKFWITRLPSIGEHAVTTLRCVGKEEKNGRQWITFSSESNGVAGQLLFRGQMTTIWAA
ncbi:MAG: hypothetical protein WBF47_13990 [Xanthobacteraceae bacterium]|jgi:hypothetical protein